MVTFFEIGHVTGVSAVCRIEEKNTTNPLLSVFFFGDKCSAEPTNCSLNTESPAVLLQIEKSHA